MPVGLEVLPLPLTMLNYRTAAPRMVPRKVATSRTGRVFAHAISAILAVSGIAAGNGEPAAPAEIEFKVLLIIKKQTDAWSPLFLPVRAEMSEAEIKAARRCFEIETPDMVQDITRGKVRFIPTVHVSDEPLRFWNPDRRDSAEISRAEMFAEFSRIAKPGQYDSVGYYFLPRDPKTGYSIPRAGYGVGWFDRAHAAGAFAVHAAEMNPRDEIFLHEWMHGLEQFYHGKPGVRLPEGWLHGIGNYRGYHERPYRPGDTFRGWMDWYKDFLNREIRESDGFSGLGAVAWKHGPMRETQLQPFPVERMTPQAGTYPAWLHKLMKGDLAAANLGADLLGDAPAKSAGGLAPWIVKRWGSGVEKTVEQKSTGGHSVIRIRNRHADDMQVIRRVKLEPFKNYVFSAEVKARGVKITQRGGRFGVTLAAGSSRSPKRIEGSADWTPMSVCFTTGEKSVDTELRLGLGGFASLTEGEAIFRNVRLRQVLYPSAE